MLVQLLIEKGLEARSNFSFIHEGLSAKLICLIKTIFPTISGNAIPLSGAPGAWEYCVKLIIIPVLLFYGLAYPANSSHALKTIPYRRSER